jgi:quercetin dioxygenase-like cupin family protein
MKLKTLPRLALVAACTTLCTMLPAQTPAPATPPPAAKLVSNVFDWEKMTVAPTPKGSRRAVFDGPTATVDKMHCHITTLNPGEKSGEPSKHLQEEVIIVKEGTVEAHWDGQSKTGGPGSVIFFAAGATTFLRNAGTTPCTYIVIYYYTPLTPKS